MGGLLKKGAWIVCRFKGGFGKKEGGVFKGVDTSMYTMIKVFCIYIQAASVKTKPCIFAYIQANMHNMHNIYKMFIVNVVSMHCQQPDNSGGGGKSVRTL